MSTTFLRVALAIGVSLTALPGAESAIAQRLPSRESGVCIVSAGEMGGQKYAVSKCYFDSDPGNYTLRKVIWERDNPQAYQDLARQSGRRMKCVFDKGVTTASGEILRTHYRQSNCKAVR